MPIVDVPDAYTGPTQGKSEVPVDGTTVRECLEALEAKYPGSLAYVLDGKGRLHRYVKLFVGEQPVGSDDLDTPVSSGDTITIVASIGGGTGY